MTNPKELEKLLSDEEILFYSKTYYLIVEELLHRTSDKRFPDYTKIYWLRTKDGNFHSFAQLIREWTIEFQCRNILVKWNGDYIQAVWDFVDEKLETVTK